MFVSCNVMRTRHLEFLSMRNDGQRLLIQVYSCWPCFLKARRLSLPKITYIIFHFSVQTTKFLVIIEESGLLVDGV